MDTLAEQPLQNRQHELDREARIRRDTITWLAEALDGNMRTSFEFAFDGQEFYGEDGGGLTPIFDEAIAEARLIVQETPGLFFELRRRIIERGELDDMKAMAGGKLMTDEGQPANTIVVPSDFPPELMDAGEDVGGYNAGRKQTMLRIITLGENGVLRVTTQSLDGSNRRALEAVYAFLGKKPEPGELLPQRINLNLPADGQASLADTLTSVYDGSMSEQFGGIWHAGRRPVDYHNTYEFANRQQDLIDWFTTEKLADDSGAEKLRFKLAAATEARYERFLASAEKSQLSVPGEITPEAIVSARGIAGGQSLSAELNYASLRAARLGKTFSGCGAGVSAEEDDGLSIEDQLSVSGYGNKTEAGPSDKFGSLKFRCPNGHVNQRERNKLVDRCGTCGVSVKCSK